MVIRKGNRLSSENGRQFIDRNSLMPVDYNKVKVNSIYIKTASNDAGSNNEFAYSMYIDCKNNLFKYISINGLPQSTTKWQSSNGCLLIKETIRIVCLQR